VGYLVSFHNFLSLCLCFNNRSKPGSSLLMFRSINLLVSSLYAEVGLPCIFILYCMLLWIYEILWANFISSPIG
jgi:hypothetical protein